MNPSIAHQQDMNGIGMSMFPDGKVPWRNNEHCSYCGSMHPADVAKAIVAGTVKGEVADMKYGWPHKVYFDGKGVKGSGKFYTIHLRDASPEDKEIIEKHIHIHFEFSEDGSSVRCTAIKDEPEKTE